jgi:nicotinate-nucleotide adenylyltransferase
MINIACEKDKRLEVSDFEIKSKKNFKAIEIFKIIENEYRKDEIFFIMGADNLKKLSSWKNSEELIKNYNYIIFEREDIKSNEILKHDCLLNKYKNNFKIISNTEYANCSATVIRKQIKEGSMPENINIKVYEYIKKNNLYR